MIPSSLLLALLLALLAHVIAQVDKINLISENDLQSIDGKNDVEDLLVDKMDIVKGPTNSVPTTAPTKLNVVAYAKVTQNITGITVSDWISCNFADDYFSQTIYSLISNDDGATSIVNYVNNIHETNTASGIILNYDLIFFYTMYSADDDMLDTSYDAILYYLNNTIIQSNNMTTYFSTLCSNSGCTALGNAVMTISYSVMGPYEIDTPSPTTIPTNFRQSSYKTNKGRLAVVLVLLLGFMVGSVAFSFCRYAKKHNKKMTAFDKWNNYTQTKSLTVEEAARVSESRRSANISLGDTFSPMMKKIDQFPPSLTDTSNSNNSSNSSSGKDNNTTRLGSVFVQNPMSNKRISTMPISSSGKVSTGTSSQENSPQVSRRKSVSFNASLEIPGNSDNIDPIATLQTPPAVSPILRRQSLIGVSSPPPSSDVTDSSNDNNNSNNNSNNDRSASTAMNMHNMARRRSNEMIGHLKSPTSTISNVNIDSTAPPPVSPRVSRRQSANDDENGL